MDKHGDVVGFTWVELAGIIFAAVLIGSTVLFFTRFVSIFSGGDEDRASEVAFRTLGVEMNKLLNSDDACSAVEKLPLFVGGDFAIVGFGRNNLLVNPCNAGEVVARPVRPDCKNGQSCLCLFKTDSSFAGEQPLSCISLNVDELVMPVYTNDFRDRGGSELSVFKNMGGTDVANYAGKPLFVAGRRSLFIFGECSEHWDDESFGTKVMYVERSVENGKSGIYVAYADADAEIAYDDCLKKQKPVVANQLTDQVSSVVGQANTLMQEGIAQSGV